MTLVSDIIRQVTRSFGDTDQILLTNQDFFDWINAAQLDIVKQTECIVTRSTAAASTFPVTIPANHIRTQRVLYGSTPLSVISVDELDSKAIDVSTGVYQPWFFYFDNTKINLYPLQASSDTTIVTWQYIRTPVAVAATTDALTIPTTFDDQLRTFVLARAHERNENQNAKQFTLSEYDSAMARNKELAFELDDTFDVIRDDPYGEW